MVTTSELRAMLKKAPVVFAWCIITNGDGHYLQVTKSSVTEALKGYYRKARIWTAEIREDGDLYLG